MIRKVPGGYQLRSHDGSKVLSKVLPTKAAAEKREAQVRYFKARGK